MGRNGRLGGLGGCPDSSSRLYSAIVDADTTTLLTYGAQEGVARGYVGKRQHRYGSYAPIMSSEGRTGLSLGIQLRSGNVHNVLSAGLQAPKNPDATFMQLDSYTKSDGKLMPSAGGRRNTHF